VRDHHLGDNIHGRIGPVVTSLDCVLYLVGSRTLQLKYMLSCPRGPRLSYWSDGTLPYVIGFVMQY
jgi:hypothetical protein